MESSLQIIKILRNIAQFYSQTLECKAVLGKIFYYFYFLKIFVIQLQLYAFSPHVKKFLNVIFEKQPENVIIK